MRNKSDYSLGALGRLDAAFDAISCPLNLGGGWEQWERVLAAVEVVIWKKDKLELEEYEDMSNDNGKQDFEVRVEKLKEQALR